MFFRYGQLVKGAAGWLLSPWFSPFRCIVEIRFATPDMIFVGFADFPLVGATAGLPVTPLLSTFFCSYFHCRRRGAIYHAGHTDDDGCLVDVCAHRHLLVHGQPSSLPHHHADRELHTVSILEMVFPTNSFWKLIDLTTVFQPNGKSENVNSPELNWMKSAALIGRSDLLPISHVVIWCQKENKAKKSQEKYKWAPCFNIRERGNASKVDHFAFTCSTDTRIHMSMHYSSVLRALCLSIVTIICLLASLLVAVGNAHLSWANQHAGASAMPGSATVNCALLWNKQHLFLLISSSLSLNLFLSEFASPFSLSLSNTQMLSHSLFLPLSATFPLYWKVLYNADQVMQSLHF